MDSRDFNYPHGFHVRIYDDKLFYKVHSAVPYKSTTPGHLIYIITRSVYRIDIWLIDDDIVTQLNVYGSGSCQHFSKKCSVEEIVRSTLSHIGRIVTLDNDSIQPTLF